MKIKNLSLVIVLCIVLALSACGNNITTDNTPPLGTSDPPIESTGGDDTMNNSTPLTPKSIVDSITYVNCRFYFPVSYVSGGKQQLSGYDKDINWFDWQKEVAERVESAPDFDTLRTIETMYSEGESGDFRIFTDIVSNGDWEFFPVKVRYEEYTLDNQPAHKEWIDYFGEKITKISPETPLIFKEAWFFDWDMDGEEEVMVVASNVIWHVGVGGDGQKGAAPNPPPADKTAKYEMSALFINGNDPINYGERIGAWTSKEQLGEENYIHESYLPFKGGENTLSVIQLDAQGKFMKCPVYGFDGINGTNKLYVLLCDIDGDGMSELLTWMEVVYAPIIVHKLIDGKPQEVFKIHTGA